MTSNRKITAGGGQVDTINTLKFSTVKSSFDSQPVTHEGTLTKFVEHLHDGKQIALPRDEFVKLDKLKRDKLKDGPAIILSEFDPDKAPRTKARGWRSKNHVAKVTGATFDLDNGNPDMGEVAKRLNGLAFVIHESASSKPEARKLRVFVPYSQPVGIAQHEAAWADLARQLDPAWLDRTIGRDPGRLCYAPPIFKGGDRGALVVQEGAWHDPTTVVAPAARQKLNGSSWDALHRHLKPGVDLKGELAAVATGQSFHDALLKATASMAAQGSSYEQIEAACLAVLEGSRPTDPETLGRWQREMNDLPRTIRTALERYAPEVEEEIELPPLVQVGFDSVAPELPVPIIENWLPRRVVTLFSGHGDVGKSFTSLEVGVRIALGRPVFGHATLPGKVIYYSCEDEAAVIRARADPLANHLGARPADLHGKLIPIDMTSEVSPELYRERRKDDPDDCVGVLLPRFWQLWDLAEAERPVLVIVDNASDVFAANENNRAQVREFMRSLKAIAQEFDCAVLLLGHVQKSVADAKAGQQVQAYSGSSAWHNSARSRWSMLRQEEDRGVRELKLEKSNYGKSGAAVEVLWHEDKKLLLAGVTVERVPLVDLEGVILQKLVEYADKGVELMAALKATGSAQSALRGDVPELKKYRPTPVQDVLERFYRDGLLAKKVRATKGSNNGRKVDLFEVTDAAREKLKTEARRRAKLGAGVKVGDGEVEIGV